jgi:hypothetical protein
MIITVTVSLRDGTQRSTIRTQLDTIDTALANFVAQNRRLPCPADGLIASGAPGVGQETLSPGPPPATVPPKGTCNPVTQANGIVPWVTLGLTEADATDPWGGRITYRVDPALAGDTPFLRLMDMSNCDPSSVVPGGSFPAIGGCKVPAPPCTGTVGCTSPTEFLFNKGLDVWDGVNGVTGWNLRQNNRSAGTGAAYVLISHGPSGRRAYNRGGVLQQGSVVVPTNDEDLNHNGLAVVLSNQNTSYRDAPINESVSAAHFDDYLSHPTIMSVLNRANLGPRAHP